MVDFTNSLIESQELNEDVIGDYASSYLNLSGEDRIAAMKEFKDKLEKENVFDFELMHKALDAEFGPLGLLKVFKRNGEFVSRAAYGNLVTHPLYNRIRTKSDPVLNALINFWAKIYGSDRSPDLQIVTAEQKSERATTAARDAVIATATAAVNTDLDVVAHKLCGELMNRHPEYKELCNKYDIEAVYTAFKPKLTGDASCYYEVDKNDPRVFNYKRDPKKLHADKCVFKDDLLNITVLKVFMPLSQVGFNSPNDMAKSIADQIDKSWDNIFEGLKGFYHLD